MAQAHVRGNLPFPCLITQLAHQAEVPWEQGDETPTFHGKKEKVIPYGNWFGDHPVARCRDRAALAAATAPTISSAAAGPSAASSAPSTPAPSSTSQSIYHLVQRLFECMDQIERRNKNRYQHLRRIVTSDGADIPFEPDTPSDQSEEEEEAQPEEAQQQEAELEETHHEAPV
ncbi:hypothetical protein AHAS_Ahas20G0162800 [Arachis hypogaea]